MNTLSTHHNGNCYVELFDDGTKIRSWEGDAEPRFPESIDLKITNYCDAGCPYCHEQSTKRGEHAPFENIVKAVEGLPPGHEVAIGGGNPLSHPDLKKILLFFRSRGLISNITVNSFHVFKAYELIQELRDKKLIYGLGISFCDNVFLKEFDLIDNNTIIHVIAGVDSVHQVRKLPDNYKLLVLGYKHFGFGAGYADKHNVDLRLREWRYWIPTLMRKKHISFDNLALKQMGIKDILSPEEWDRLYMGDDGQFTMYVDAVKSEFAVSSTHNKRFPVSGVIEEMFTIVKSTHPELVTMTGQA